MTRTFRQLLLPAALVALALIVPAQSGASVLEVQRDCADSDTFERKHSRADLQRALSRIQADLGEYGTCRQMILAELAARDRKRNRDGGPGGRGGAGGFDSSADTDGDGVISPEERRAAREKAERERRATASIDNTLIQDDDRGSAGATGRGGGGGGTPLPVILTIVALACAGTGGGLWYAAKRNPSIDSALRRVPLPFRNG